MCLQPKPAKQRASCSGGELSAVRGEGSSIWCFMCESLNKLKYLLLQVFSELNSGVQNKSMSKTTKVRKGTEVNWHSKIS